MWFLLIAGLNSRFLWPLAYGSLLLALLVSGYALLSLAWKAREAVKKWEEKKNQSIVTMPASIESTGKIGRSAIKGTLLVLVGIAAGYAIRDMQQFHHSYVLSDVRVLRQDSPTAYLLQTDRGQAFEMYFCDGTPAMPTGARIKLMKYEETHGCANITEDRTGILFSRNERGEIQTGE